MKLFIEARQRTLAGLSQSRTGALDASFPTLAGLRWIGRTALLRLERSGP
jgi:hypothetical protein